MSPTGSATPSAPTSSPDVRPGRHPGGPEVRGLLQPGGLRLPRPQHRGQGHGRLPPALPLRQRGVRLLDGVTPTGPPPAPCGATASPRPCGPGSATSTTSAQASGMDPMEFRRKNLMPVGYTDGFSKNELYSDTFNQCMDKGMAGCWTTTGNTRNTRTRPALSAGAWACAVFWYNTGCVAHLAGVLLLPDGAEPGRLPPVPDRRDGDRPGLRHRLSPRWWRTRWACRWRTSMWSPPRTPT